MKQLFENVYYVNIKNWVKNHYNLKVEFKKKTFIYKNQGRKPIHQKYKAYERTNRHNPKKQKQKQTISKKIRKKPYANRTHGYEMMTNNNKKDLR